MSGLASNFQPDSHMPLLSLPISTERLWQRVEELAKFTDPQRPWTRRAFGDLHAQSRQWLRSQMEAAGLQVRLDAGGNLIGRRPGKRDDLPPLMTGSHCDTVMDGGRFDGIIGVLAGIEIAHAMHDAGVVLEHPFEVVDFLSEEPSDYGISCVGSRAMVGMLDASMLAAARLDGETLAQGIDRCGGDAARIGEACRGQGGIAAFVELHIEQGPVLEARELPIGVVSNIVGIRRTAITITGRPDHAGTTPMDLRRDALVGASRLIDGAYRLASELNGQPHYVVATVGNLHNFPNASNAVPGRVELTLEARSDAHHVLTHFVETLLERCGESVAQTGATIATRELNLSAPTQCHATAMQAVADAANALSLDNIVLPSGAGHDAAYMAKLGPSGMVFIPCLNGRSHCPEEWCSPEQLLDGTRVLAQSLVNLDSVLLQP